MPSAAALPLAQLLGHAAAALQAVRAGESLDAALARTPAEARPGTQALAFHALRHLGAALAARRQLVRKTPPAELDALLLVALALLWPGMEPPPYAEHTLVDQAVAAARHRNPARAGFVNAVLRRFVRERAALVEAAAQDEAALFEHPGWWIERLRRDWPGDWQRILRDANEHPPLTLRVNARHGSAAAYVERLAAEGIAARVVGAQAVQLERARPVAQLPGFAEGAVSVQDAAAQLAAPLLLGAGLAAGARVLDACAAPGGKSAHLLELADLELLALDIDAGRLARVEATLERLGLAARVQRGDAREPAAWWDGRPFDAILLDAPCSASGIVRRHPDVRWLRRASDIEALARTQAQLLDALWPLLAPRRRLLYCTCSVFKAEGQEGIDAFLQRTPDARHADAPAAPGCLLPLADNPGHGVGASMDGFFYALIEKH